MSAYRCYLRRRSGQIAKACVIEAPTDVEAPKLVLNVFKMSEEFPFIEIWQRERLVARLALPGAPPRRALAKSRLGLRNSLRAILGRHWPRAK